jgi:hypothetical protein
MDNKYEINDIRGIKSFKIETFSGYKKTDVIKTLFKSIDSKKIENASNWLIECIVSGYILDIWEKMIIYASNIISINNPNLPNILYKKNILFYNIINRYNINSNKEELLLLRNNLELRHIFFSLLGLIILSDKTKRYDNYPKITEDDFNFDNVVKRLQSKFNLLPNNFIKFNEPEELKLIINEIYYYLKDKKGGYEKSIYWIIWLIEWEKLNKKKLKSWNINERNIEVKKKYRNDVVWIIWELIFLECKEIDKNISKQINSLYELFIYDYNLQKKNKRLSYLYQSVCYLTNDVDFDIEILENMNIYLKLQTSVNLIFSNKKINEKNDLKLAPKPKLKKIKNKNKKEVIKEKCEDKLNIFNNIDNII